LGLFRKRTTNVGRLQRRGNVEGLVAAAQHRDTFVDRDGSVVDVGGPVRREAVLALADIEDPRARAAARDALADADLSVRLAALESVRRTHDEDALPDAIQMAFAAVAHGEAAGEAVLGSLIQLAEPARANLYARGLIAHPSGELLHPQELRLFDEVIGSAPAEFQQRLIDELVVVMGTADADGQARAAGFLVALGDSAIEPAIRALGNPRTRLGAAVALGFLRSQRAVEPLLATVTDADAAVRRVAVRALGEIKDGRAVEALLSAARDEDYGVRAAAIKAIDSLGTLAVIQSVATLVGSEALPAGGEPARRLEQPAGSQPGVQPDGDPAPAPRAPAPVRPAQALRRLLGRPD
jgi:HEAT repeat protein